MALIQRLTQVGKDLYLLELLELYQIRPTRRTTFLLAPSKTDTPIGQKSREKALPLSLKTQMSSHCKTVSSPLPIFLSFNLEKTTLLQFCLFLINKFKNSLCVHSLGFLTLCTISAVHFHHLSTHATCVTRVHVVGDFYHIPCHFMAPDTRCLKKRVNSDCLRIR